MKERLRGIMQISFVKNIIVLVTGTAAAQIISLLLSPVITRIYGPEAYGVMGSFISIIGILAPISALTFPIAIVLPKEDEIAKGLIKLSLIVTLATTTITILIIVLLNKQLIEVFNLKIISSYLFLIPLVILFSGVMQIAEQWLIRTQQFSINARATFLQSLIINSSKVGFGFLNPAAFTLVILSALGNGLRAGLMILFSKNRIYEYSNSMKIDSLKLAKQYNDFPKYRAPESFISAISQNLPVLILASLAGPASAGFYSIARTALFAPVGLVGKAVSDVFYPRLSEALRYGEDLKKLTFKATIYLIIIGTIPFSIVILWGPPLFVFVFGNEWVYAGEYARWLAIMSFGMLISRPAVSAIPVINAQRFHLVFTLITTVVRFVLLYIGLKAVNEVFAIALFGISSGLLYILLIIIVLLKSNNINLRKEQQLKLNK